MTIRVRTRSLGATYRPTSRHAPAFGDASVTSTSPWLSPTSATPQPRSSPARVKRPRAARRPTRSEGGERARDHTSPHRCTERGGCLPTGSRRRRRGRGVGFQDQGRRMMIRFRRLVPSACCRLVTAAASWRVGLVGSEAPARMGWRSGIRLAAWSVGSGWLGVGMRVVVRRRALAAAVEGAVRGGGFGAGGSAGGNL